MNGIHIRGRVLSGGCRKVTEKGNLGDNVRRIAAKESKVSKEPGERGENSVIGVATNGGDASYSGKVGFSYHSFVRVIGVGVDGDWGT